MKSNHQLEDRGKQKNMFGPFFFISILFQINLIAWLKNGEKKVIRKQFPIELQISIIFQLLMFSFSLKRCTAQSIDSQLGNWLNIPIVYIG